MGWGMHDVWMDIVYLVTHRLPANVQRKYQLTLTIIPCSPFHNRKLNLHVNFWIMDHHPSGISYIEFVSFCFYKKSFINWSNKKDREFKRKFLIVSLPLLGFYYSAAAIKSTEQPTPIMLICRFSFKYINICTNIFKGNFLITLVLIIKAMILWSTITCYNFIITFSFLNINCCGYFILFFFHRDRDCSF